MAARADRPPERRERIHERSATLPADSRLRIAGMTCLESARHAKTLVMAGKVTDGEIVGNAWNSRAALDEVRKARGR